MEILSKIFEKVEEIPKSRQIYVNPSLHMELKAYADFRQQSIKVVAQNLLRKALDEIERESELDGASSGIKWSDIIKRK